MRLTRGRSRRIWVAASVLLGVVGVTLLLLGLHAQKDAPQPPPSAAGTYALGATGPAGSSRSHDPRTHASGSRSHHRHRQRPSTPVPPATPKIKGPVLPRSIPTHLTIPAIGVDSDMIRLGLNADHTVQVPPLGPDSKAGWYRYSPTPGQAGPSIVLGHIDSAKYGAGVFYKLGALRKGDLISVREADHKVAVFRVEAVAEYPKNQFPTLTVYGNTDHAALRLITCGGKFDFSARSYEDNIVAFASLIRSHKA